jgi:hypothetical protein
MLHDGRRIKVEWGIGGLKCKFRRFLKSFDNTIPRLHHRFRTAAILTNFIHRQRMNMAIEDMGTFVGMSETTRMFTDGSKATWVE